MALPIAPTPTLYGKDAEEFLKKLYSGKKYKLVPNPKFKKLTEELMKRKKNV